MDDDNTKKPAKKGNRQWHANCKQKRNTISGGFLNMGPPDHERNYSISEAADILCISVPTLRMYEREGLVIPFRRASGHRAFTESALERIRCFRHTMVRDKITIAGLKRLLSLMPCWKVLGCTEEARAVCPGYLNREGPCWLRSGKAWQMKNEKCLDCEVYRMTADAGHLVHTIARYTATNAPGTAHP